MATSSKKEIGDLSNLKNTYFSIESIQKFLILNRNKKYDSRKMNTAVFTKTKTKCKHHIISSFRTGDILCDKCGEIFDRIYYSGVESNTRLVYARVHKTSKKYRKNGGVRNNIDLISFVGSNLELPPKILNRASFFFQEAVDNINIRNGFKKLYALSCVFYSLKESHSLILSKELLEAHYGKVNRDILHNFYRTYHDLTEKLELKKMILGPDHYLFRLSEKFRLDKKNENMIKIILTRTTKNLPANKQMNSGIAAGAFYVNSKINNLKISQEQIANELKISTWTVCEYTKEISCALSIIYCKKRKTKLKSKDFQHLKKELGKINQMNT